ncbi:MAG: TonB-dependent receptor plug domain-containing protein, partial [Burkholderiaceae bacterium]
MPSFHLRAAARAAALSVLPLALTAPMQVQAQFSSSPAAGQPLDPVIVIGTREAQPLRNSVADVVLIDHETLRDSAAGSVADVLRRYAGLQVLANGGPGQASGYLLRGAPTSSTVVMVDGLRVGSASLGQAAFEAMSVSQIERIEVLRGPASSLYGADAMGGVIQIFTKRGQGPLRVTGNLAAGEYGSKEGNAG